MLDAIGIPDMDALFAAVPDALKLARPLNLPAPHSEWELARVMEGMAAKNATTKTHNSFLGGGAYEHYIPAVVDAIVSRGEFLTSYTPYQPEISQGLLQSLAEYQQALGLITGMPVVNGSCYDGATALADAAWTACVIHKDRGNALLVSGGVWPQWQQVVKTYMDGRGATLRAFAPDSKTGRIDVATLEKQLAAEKPAGFLFQTPNALGIFEDVAAIAQVCAKHEVVSVCAYNPLASGVTTPPGAQGVDIVVCDGQPLGLPLSAGGPSLGVYATRKEFRRYVPGRLVGKVTDINGKLAYALVYEDREQHVARERATSNICSNQALNAIRAVIYLSSLGESGFAKVAALNVQKSHYLAEKLKAIPGVALPFTGAFFNEFVISLPQPAEPLLRRMQAQGVFAGIDYSGQFGLTHALLVTATEVKSKAQMDALAALLAKELGA
ncbi:MAG: aminomethyl-transferring glycine dehydrogenase subunit GcvPA [Proteobacteria bacterium]|nr:aminomethyl-transferring glycine dehydrogenase subunit GcvPA [Pseudomonadota bacterium]